MQAFKLKGTIDEAGKLTVAEDVDLGPGEVEVIVLRAVQSEEVEQLDAKPAAKDVDRLPAIASFEEFSEWMLGDMPSFSSDFDPEDAKWQYLKEKHNL